LEFLAKIVQDEKMAENGQFLTGFLKDSFDLEEFFWVSVKNFWPFSARSLPRTTQTWVNRQ
jgi:hypothetical protein